MQYVSLNGHSSDTLEITCGVPQGSLLGPMLFLIYIIDITSATNLFHVILFADYTNMFPSNKDLPSLIDKTNIELDALYKWLLVNKLSLNVDKTNFIIFSGKRACTAHTDVLINGVPITHVNHAIFLGVYDMYIYKHLGVFYEAS